MRIIYAAESGSRAWGFASPDSDFDVRFIFVRPLEKYFSLEGAPDFLTWQADKIFDVNGWDIAKTLRQFKKSNFALFEWTNSPIVYRTSGTWEKICAATREYFSARAVFAAYAAFARKIYQASLCGASVSLKKYFYALRTILCRNYVAEKLSPPPVEFEKLLSDELPEDLLAAIDELSERKKSATEKVSTAKIPVLQNFIETELAREEQLKKSLPQESPRSWKGLNEIFRRCVRGEL